MDEFDYFLTLSQNPLIKCIAEMVVGIVCENGIVKNKGFLGLVLESIDFLNKKPHQLIPGKEDILDQGQDSLVFKLQVLALH